MIFVPPMPSALPLAAPIHQNSGAANAATARRMCCAKTMDCDWKVTERRIVSFLERCQNQESAMTNNIARYLGLDQEMPHVICTLKWMEFKGMLTRNGRYWQLCRAPAATNGDPPAAAVPGSGEVRYGRSKSSGRSNGLNGGLKRAQRLTASRSLSNQWAENSRRQSDASVTLVRIFI